MKIQLILENNEECLSLSRYIKYCLDAQVSYYTYLNFSNISLTVLRENPDITIVISHYEDKDYPPPHLSDLGLQIIRSHSKANKIVLVLYENLNENLPKDWECFLKVPWQNVNLCERIRRVIDNKVIPTKEEIDKLNGLYPPIILNHHHHIGRREYG